MRSRLRLVGTVRRRRQVFIRFTTVAAVGGIVVGGPRPLCRATRASAALRQSVAPGRRLSVPHHPRPFAVSNGF